MATEVKPRDGTVEVNGLRLHYLDWGNATAQPMLLLHGFTGQAHGWDTFAAALGDAYHIVALDQRGHGDSDWAPDYQPEHSVSDIQGFVAALQLHHLVLLGHSMGGGNAIHYVAAHPEEVERLVIVDIGPAIAAAGSARVTEGSQARDEFDTEEEAIDQLRGSFSRADATLLAARTHYNLKPLPNGKLTWKWIRPCVTRVGRGRAERRRKAGRRCVPSRAPRCSSVVPKVTSCPWRRPSAWRGRWPTARC